MPRSFHVAVVIDLNWPFRRHYEVLAGIRDFAEKQTNWTFDLGNFPQYELAQGKSYDGIVGRVTKECHAAARKAGIPVVNVWSNSPVAKRVPGVYCDSRAVGKMAAEHLIERGFRSLACFGYLASAESKLQYHGMCDVARKHGYRCAWYATNPSFSDTAANWANFVAYVKRIQKSWEAPLGIAFALDQLCHSVLTICRAEGWKIPEELALIGCGDDQLICNASDPALSSIDLAAWDCGQEAARVLNDIMCGRKPPASPVMIQPKKLLVRKSTDSYAVSDQRVARALGFMLKQSSDSLSVQDIAQFTGVGRQTLERGFQAHLGRTINEELIRMRISKLKQLLVETEESIKELSIRVGFGTTASMFPMFKRHTGITPMEYREKHGSSLGLGRVNKGAI